MKIPEYKIFESFFESLNKRNQYLLGFSGGSDSTFLFFLLKYFNIRFIAAHVDYGWRTTSHQEASGLRELCERENIPFRLHTVQNHEQESTSNAENCARDVRLHFFEQICIAENLSGVFIAHHLDDQIETILKRCFEGSALWNLRGLSERRQIGNLEIFRPLLVVRKKDILNFLEKCKTSYVQDETNFDLKYLRARFRLKIIPVLDEFFGKSLDSSLIRLSQSSGELLEFLEEEAAFFLNSIRDSEKDVSIDFSLSQPKSMFLWKFVIRKFFDFEKITTSQHTLETIIDHCCKKSKNRSLRVGKFLVLIDKGKLTLYTGLRSRT